MVDDLKDALKTLKALRDMALHGGIPAFRQNLAQVRGVFYLFVEYPETVTEEQAELATEAVYYLDGALEALKQYEETL